MTGALVIRGIDTDSITSSSRTPSLAGSRRRALSHGRYVNEYAQWEKDECVTHCAGCGVKFSFLVRKHHCRCCGRIYCASCCSAFAFYDKTRVRPVLKSEREYEMEPYRTCNMCYENLLQMRLLRTQWGGILYPETVSTRFPNDYDSSSAADAVSVAAGTKNMMCTEESRPLNIHQPSEDDFDRCPICNLDLRTFGSDESAKQNHVETCLRQAELARQQHSSLGSPTYQNRMLVYRIPDDATNIQECPICFEDMLPGQKVARLECLCVFHYDCIKKWMKKKSQLLAAQNRSADAASISMLGRNYCPLHDAVNL